MKLKTSWKLLAASFAAALSVASVSPAALADTFTPQNDPPVVTITSAPTWMQPASPRSTSTYTVSATIGSQGTAANLATVQMCWYLAPTGNSDCNATADGSGKIDPRYEFKMVWSQSANSYSVGGGTNNYRDSGSTSTYGDGSGLTMDIDFKFKISEAMLNDGNWNVTVVAVDDQGQSSRDSVDPLSDYDWGGQGVYYFGGVSTQRSSQDWGTLAYQGQSTISNISNGAFIANGYSNISLAASDFVNGSNTIYINGDNTQAPGPGEVALDCEPRSTFTGSGGYRIGTSATALEFGVYGNGTGETADSSYVHSCTLLFGGGATTANILYTNSVTVSIGPGI